MTNIILTLCNHSGLNVFGEASLNNHTLFYLDDCFQQIFVVTPAYLILLVLISFYLGLYTSHRISFYHSLKLINWITFGRYFSIVLIASLQTSISIVDISHLTIIARLSTLLKFF